MLLRLFLVGCWLLLAQYPSLYGTTITVSLSPAADEQFLPLDDQFKDAVYVHAVAFGADISISHDELASLTELKANESITVEKLRKACWNLKRKNKFDTVTFSFKKTGTTTKLIVSLKAAWTFSKVSFKGSLVGKDRYEQYYTLAGGELFNLEKHQQSLIRIQQELANQGYLHAQVTDTLYYDKDTKAVKVTLYVGNTDIFTIDKVTVVVTFAQKDLDSKNITDKITSLVQAELVGNAYSQQLVIDQLEEIKLYLARKGFLGSQVDFMPVVNKKEKTVRVKYMVTVKDHKRFVFLGNMFFTGQQLLDELIETGVSTFSIPPALFSEDIAALYKQKGFWHCTVHYKEENDRLLFLITEGDRIAVAKVTLKGCNAFSVQAVTKKFFKEFYKCSHYDADLLKQALDRLGDYYIKNGFWDFTVLKQMYKQLDNKALYELEITVEEGQQRMLYKVTLDKFSHLAYQEPFTSFIPHEPQPFNIYTVQEQRRCLLKQLQKEGFYYAQVKPEFITHPQGIELKWHIETTEVPVVFGKTIVTGSSKIPVSLLTRDLCYKEGDIFDKEKIDQTIKQLKDLHIFQSISLVPYEPAQSENPKTMLLTCIEDDPIEVRARLGLQQTSKNLLSFDGTTYKLGGSLLWKNPTKSADILAFDADITRYTRDIALTYQMPWVGPYRLNTSIKAYSSCYEQPVIARSRQTLYKESRNGVALDLHKLYKNYQTSLVLGAEYVKLFCLSDTLARAIDFKPVLVNKRVPCLVTEPSIFIDRPASVGLTTTSSFTRLSAKAVVPLGYYHYYFVKLSFEQSFIKPLYRSIIGATRLRIGHIFNNAFDTLAPSERFYLGGPNSLRGYYYDMVPPLVDYKIDTHERCWIPVGGKSMVDFTVEVRFPLYGKLSGTLFNDMGALAQYSIKDLFKNGVGATGLGLRYDTPLGPVRFDIGWKWRKWYPQERRYAWFLTFGHAF